MRAQQQFGEIHTARTLTGRLILAVDRNHLPLIGITRVIQVLRTQALVLLLVDEPLRLTRRPLGVIQVHLTHNAFDQALLVVGIQYLKALRQSRLLPVCTQQPMRQSVEGPDPHAADRLAQQRLDTVAHLARRLVGESDREDTPG